MSINLQAYFQRIGFDGEARADRTTLDALHLAHRLAIPFENLDVQLALPIRLDLDALQAKLVARRRGGYCFEQNTLFMAVLKHIGFEVEPFEARVWVDPNEVLPRTHMLLGVRVEGRHLIADVGFGADGILRTVAIDGGGEESEQFGDIFRIHPDGPLRQLQRRAGGDWMPLYTFLPEARFPADFEMGNHYTSTYPESRFIRTLTVQLHTLDARHILRNRTYSVRQGEACEVRELKDAEIIPLLREVFGVDVPEGARFRALCEA